MLANFSECFHGTITIYADQIMDSIDLTKGRMFTDFGQGFYVTHSYEQAKIWAIAKYKDNLHIAGVKPAIVKMKLDLAILQEHYESDRGMIFTSSDEAWSDFVYACRKHGQKNEMYHSYSFVCGGMADGKIAPLVKKRNRGEITSEQFLARIQPLSSWSPQLSFHDANLLKCMISKEVLHVEKLI